MIVNASIDLIDEVKELNSLPDLLDVALASMWTSRDGAAKDGVFNIHAVVTLGSDVKSGISFGVDAVSLRRDCVRFTGTAFVPLSPPQDRRLFRGTWVHVDDSGLDGLYDRIIDFNQGSTFVCSNVAKGSHPKNAPYNNTHPACKSSQDLTIRAMAETIARFITPVCAVCAKRRGSTPPAGFGVPSF